MTTLPDNGVVAPVQAHSKPPFLRRVKISGYKSIASCELTLEPLTILVGRNGSGKSNFLDVLGFLRDALNNGVGSAVKSRGGWDAIACRVSAARSLLIELDLEVGPLQDSHCYFGSYLLEIRSAGGTGLPEVGREELKARNESGQPCLGFRRDSEKIEWHDQASGSSPGLSKWCPPDRLFLGSFGMLPLRGFGQGILSMAFYGFNPNMMRAPQPARPANVTEFLECEGGNIASVLEAIGSTSPATHERIQAYLSVIVPEVERIRAVTYGPYQTVRFRYPRYDLDALNVSDGTLRALATLVAAFQSQPGLGPSLVGIDEPETSLHPAAMHALVDALDEATLRSQIVLTTHSAEILDNPTIRPENVRVVQMIDGKTVIGPVDAASVEIIRRKLNTLGGLERENQLQAENSEETALEQTGSLLEEIRT